MIGGNKYMLLQVRSSSTNKIGEQVAEWIDAVTVYGWLDLQNGDSKYTNYGSKIQESTHVFVADYVDLGDIEAENARAIIDGKVYDVMLLDDPMDMHKQLEVYLKYTGGQ